MSLVPAELKYTKEHEWIAPLSENRFRIGITDFAQSSLGDIVYIQLPKVGDSVQSGEVCGEVESTKSVSEIYSPLSGTVVAINENLDSKPELINSEPYAQGWIAEIEIPSGSVPSNLLTATEYQNLTA